MNKKIASEFAIGVILLVSFVVGGIFWLKGFNEGKDINMNSEAPKKVSLPAESVSEVIAKADKETCKPHYYEGDEEVEGWFVSEEKDGIVVAIKNSDISKLPATDVQIGNQGGNFNVKLIDPTDKIRLSIKASSEKKPVMVKVKGYAEICQQPPLISLQPATIAFKKS